MHPDTLQYTPEHEWVEVDDDGSLRAGITDYAQQQLGDVVFVQLPEIGTTVAAGEPCGEVESTKSVSDVYAPVSGTVVARNEALEASPELVNSDPYGEGWLLRIEPGEGVTLDDLISAQAYRILIGE